MSNTKIEWTDQTVNPWVGCTKVSPSCQNCYAERMAKRLKAMGLPQYQDVVDENGWTGKISLTPSMWPPKFPGAKAKPKMIFVGSMTDIFHEDVPFAWIKNFFCYMLASNGRNIFQILTKRPDRMAEFFSEHFKNDPPNPKFWLGVSVCNQFEADVKLPIFLPIPAAVKFVSVEPLLGGSYVTGVNLTSLPCNLAQINEDEPFYDDYFCALTGSGHDMQQTEYSPRDTYPTLDWVICGGENGPGARPMHPDWARGLRDQCIDADVPFFFKGFGEWWPESGGSFLRLGKKQLGRLLDGKLWKQFPERRDCEG